jgi:hypothetical protein
MPMGMNQMNVDPNFQYYQNQQEGNPNYEPYPNEGSANRLDAESTDFRKSIFQKNIDNMNSIYHAILGGNKQKWNMYSVENDGEEFLGKIGTGQNGGGGQGARGTGHVNTRGGPDEGYDENGGEVWRGANGDGFNRKNFVNYS